MTLIISTGSGRARCRICGEKIRQIEIDVELSEYKMSRHYHGSCIKSAIDDFVPSNYARITERYTSILPKRSENSNKDRIR